MRLKIMAVTLALAAAAALAACGPQDGSAPATNSARQNPTPATANNAAAGPHAPAARATPAATPSDGVRRVTIAESRVLAERGEAVIYDVRDDHSFETSHVSGAKLVPLSDVPARATEFPKDKLIITYCA